jgi:hypothetical protein
MGYIRKFHQGRCLAFFEVAERLAADPKAMFYHRGWMKPVSGAFLQNWQVHQLRTATLRGLICEALLNPAYTAKHQGGSND